MKNKLILTIILCGIGSIISAKMENPEMDGYTTYLMEADEYTTMGKESTPTSDMRMGYDYEMDEIDASPYGESMPIKRTTDIDTEAVNYSPEEEYLEDMTVDMEPMEQTEEPSNMSMMDEEMAMKQVEPEYDYYEEETTQYGPEKEDPYIN
jgi:uncharacterized protein YxeA